MSNMKRIAGALLLASGGLLVSSTAQSGIMAASKGSAWDPTQTSCFVRGWNEPGRVAFENCSGSGLWDMPVPISSTGSKTFRVYGRATSGPGQTCAAFVLRANGSIIRWKEITLEIAEDWHRFEAQNVNAEESVVIECNLLQAGTVWVGAVKGF